MTVSELAELCSDTYENRFLEPRTVNSVQWSVIRTADVKLPRYKNIDVCNSKL